MMNIIFEPYWKHLSNLLEMIIIILVVFGYAHMSK